MYKLNTCRNDDQKTMSNRLGILALQKLHVKVLVTAAVLHMQRNHNESLSHRDKA
jgi:hypothetical protein